MEQGLKELDKQDAVAAAKEGERSAEQLERLADHLAAMNARDFGQRLDQAQKLARNWPNKQQSLAQSQQSGSAKSDGGKNESRKRLANERALAAKQTCWPTSSRLWSATHPRERGGIQGKLRSVQAENPPARNLQFDRQAAAIWNRIAKTRRDAVSPGPAAARRIEQVAGRSAE